MNNDVRTTARKFVAATSREALRLVREALGAEAIVLTNRASADGVEIVAMAEGDVNAAVAQVASPVPAPVMAAPVIAMAAAPSAPMAPIASMEPTRPSACCAKKARTSSSATSWANGRSKSRMRLRPRAERR